MLSLDALFERLVSLDEFLVDDAVFADGDLGKIVLEKFPGKRRDQPLEERVVGFGIRLGHRVTF